MAATLRRAGSILYPFTKPDIYVKRCCPIGFGLKPKPSKHKKEDLHIEDRVIIEASPEWLFKEKQLLLEKVKEPLKHHDFFQVRNLTTVKELFEARVHLGHKRKLRKGQMNRYMFGTRLEQDIFDLNQTHVLLGDALNFMAHVAFRGGIFMFITRVSQFIPLVEETALQCGEYAMCRRWNTGFFTNAPPNPVYRQPDVLVFLHTHYPVSHSIHRGVIEGAQVCIPSVGVVDSNNDPRQISYPIPGNDDTPPAMELYCRMFKEAILKGKAKREELLSEAAALNERATLEKEKSSTQGLR